MTGDIADYMEPQDSIFHENCSYPADDFASYLEQCGWFASDFFLCHIFIVRHKREGARSTRLSPTCHLDSSIRRWGEARVERSQYEDMYSHNRLFSVGSLHPRAYAWGVEMTCRALKSESPDQKSISSKSFDDLCVLVDCVRSECVDCHWLTDGSISQLSMIASVFEVLSSMLLINRDRVAYWRLPYMPRRFAHVM